MKRRDLWKVVIALVLGWIFLRPLLSGGAQQVSVSPTQLEDLIKTGGVKEITFYQETKQIIAVLHDKSPRGKVATTRALNDLHAHEIRIMAEKAKIPYKVADPPSNWLLVLSNLALPLIMIWFFFSMTRGMGGAGKRGIADFLNKPIKQHQNSQTNKIT